MTTSARGNTCEATILQAFVARGLRVAVPFGDGHPYDLIVDVGGRAMLRIQCKSAWRNGAICAFNSRSTDHGNGAQYYRGRAAAFGVYLPEHDVTYLVPVGELTSGRAYLRLEPTRNNQRRKVTFAEQYELDRWSDADLVELANGTNQLEIAA
jgi:hypothetical protein